MFDIDGTLVDAGGAGRRAMELAFHRTHGRADAVSGFVFGGMTDPAIARRALGVIGVEATAVAIGRVLDAYLAALAEELPKARAFRVLPDVIDALDHVSGRGHAIGVGTGNLVEGARLKLERAGLSARFAFGGYGSDHEDRAELLSRGAAKGRAILEDERAAVVVIGDTPRDVEAARAIGATCIAVATGKVGFDELASHGAELTVRTLADPRARAVLED